MRSFEDEMRAYYRAQRMPADEAARSIAVQAAVDEARRVRMQAEAAPARRGSMRNALANLTESLSFVADQARFMSVRSWVLQACAVIAATVLMLVGDRYAASGLYACFAVVSVAVCGLPEVASSRSCGVMELERSCKHNARSVAAARMAVLACSNAVAIAVVTACMAHADTGASLAFAFACSFAPYCATTAGCLMAARRADGAGAIASAAAWGFLVVAVAYFVSSRAPWLYTQASLWIWAVVAAASLAWMAFEARAWLADAAYSSRSLSFDSSYINR